MSVLHPTVAKPPRITPQPPPTCCLIGYICHESDMVWVVCCLQAQGSLAHGCLTSCISVAVRVGTGRMHDCFLWVWHFGPGQRQMSYTAGRRTLALRTYYTDRPVRQSLLPFLQPTGTHHSLYNSGCTRALTHTGTGRRHSVSPD